MRVLDRKTSTIHGTDPSENRWSVSFKHLGSARIQVDFTTKSTHRGKQVLIATYEARRNVLHWEDGNQWLRMRQSPRHLIDIL